MNYTLSRTDEEFGGQVAIAQFETDAEIYKYIHQHHSYSVSHAMQYEGYRVHDQAGKDITKEFILK